MAIISSLFISCARFKLSKRRKKTKKCENCFLFVYSLIILLTATPFHSVCEMSDHRARERFQTLLQNTGQGSTGFAKAAENIEKGHFDGKAISPELRAVKRNEPGYTLIEDPLGILPPLRFPIGGHLTLPFDPENRKAFIEWFFACLTAGYRLREPLYQSQEVLSVDVLRRDELAVSKPPQKKAKKTRSAVPQPTTDQDEDNPPIRPKSRIKRIIQSDDEEEHQPANPPRKKEKKASIKASLPKENKFYDYEDVNGNLAGFVVSDSEFD